MEYFSIFVSALLLTCVAGGPTDCRNTYQKLLQDVTEVRKTCKEAAFKDCCQIKRVAPWSNTGTYEVAEACDDPHVFGTKSVKLLYARCDMESDGGKWMVIQRRINGSVDFYRNWTDYAYGFGDLEGEFWYGLEKIHCLTTREDVELRIELGNGTEPSIVWTYQLFRVGGADTNYRLTVGQGKGVGGSDDAMSYHNGRPFTTPDRDNDDRNGGNCAVNSGGAWWFNNCFNSNLNSRYGQHNIYSKLSWYEGGHPQHFTKVQMKIRPKQCSINEDSTC